MPKIKRPKQDVPRGPEAGRVIKPAPTGAGDDLRVVIPGFDGKQVYEVGKRWAPRDGGALPAVGDRVLVVHDDDGDPWVVRWHPG